MLLVVTWQVCGLHFYLSTRRSFKHLCCRPVDFSTLNPTLTIPSDVTVGEVIPLMRKSRSHRMVLVESDGTIMHLITQSNLVEFMLLNLDRL